MDLDWDKNLESITDSEKQLNMDHIMTILTPGQSG